MWLRSANSSTSSLAPSSAHSWWKAGRRRSANTPRAISWAGNRKPCSGSDDIIRHLPRAPKLIWRGADDEGRTLNGGTEMKKLVTVALGAALMTISTAYAQNGTGASRTGSSINSSGIGGAAGAGASSLNTPSDNNGGGARAPAKSAPVPPNGPGASAGSTAPKTNSPERRQWRSPRRAEFWPLARRPSLWTRLACRQPSVIHTIAPSMTRKPVIAVPIKTRSTRSTVAPFAKTTLTFREAHRINPCESGAALSSGRSEVASS